jgi:excisionase family DNA binding protein
MEKIALSFRQASEATSLSHWTLRKAGAQGRLRTLKVGRRRLIEPDSLVRFLKGLDDSRVARERVGPHAGGSR